MEGKRVLKKEGQLIISTPNLVCLKNRIKVLFGFMPSSNALAYPTKEDHSLYHKADYTLKWICEFLEKAGFKIIKKTSNGIFLKNKLILSEKLCPPTLGKTLILKAISI